MILIQIMAYFTTLFTDLKKIRDIKERNTHFSFFHILHTTIMQCYTDSFWNWLFSLAFSIAISSTCTAILMWESFFWQIMSNEQIPNLCLTKVHYQRTSNYNDLRLIYYHPKSFSWLLFYITKKQIKFNHFQTKIISNDRKRLNLHWTIQCLVSRLKIQITSKDPNPNHFGINYNTFKTRNKILEGKFLFFFFKKRSSHQD